jgi:carbon-monoxide dehydrogenase large subunit
VIGQRVLRKEDPRFLTGEGRYVENLPFDDALHVTFVRSPLAHARIAGIDISPAAEKAQVFTAHDLDLGMFGPPFPALDAKFARPFLAGDVVRFSGEIVAAVVAGSRVDAVDAAELVDVEYDPLDAVVTPADALESDTVLFPRWAPTSA